MDAVAVTSGPGLAGALMVGVGAAKALAVSLGKPLYAVNHLVGHIAADILKQLAKIELIVGLQQSLQAHAQVSSSTRRLMRAILKTWQNPERDAQQATHMLQVLHQRLPTFTLLHLMLNTAQ